LIPPLLSADETPPRIVAPKYDDRRYWGNDDYWNDNDGNDVSGEFDHNP